MKTRKFYFFTVWLILLVSLFPSLQAQKPEKTIHLRVVRNGVVTDTTFTTSDKNVIHQAESGSLPGTGSSSKHAKFYRATVTENDNHISVMVHESDSLPGRGARFERFYTTGDDDQYVVITDDGDMMPPVPPPPPVPGLPGDTSMHGSRHMMIRHMDGDVTIIDGHGNRTQSEYIVVDSTGKHNRIEKMYKIVVDEGDSQVPPDIDENGLPVPPPPPPPPGDMVYVVAHATHDTTLVKVTPEGDTVIIKTIVRTGNKDNRHVKVIRHGGQQGNYAYTYEEDMENVQVDKMPSDSCGREKVMVYVSKSPREDKEYKKITVKRMEGEKTDFGMVSVIAVPEKKHIILDMSLEGKAQTTITVTDEKKKVVFSDKIKDLLGRYVREIDLSGFASGKYTVTIEREKSKFEKQVNL